MNERSFIDSNVLAYTDDAGATAKRKIALDLFSRHRRAGTGVVSTQVLQEYFVVATRKLGVDVATVRRKLELFARLSLVEISLPDILAAIDLHRLHTISFWDGLIVRAAQVSGCELLYSEHLQHGRRFGSVEIRNPF